MKLAPIQIAFVAATLAACSGADVGDVFGGDDGGGGRGGGSASSAESGLAGPGSDVGATTTGAPASAASTGASDASSAAAGSGEPSGTSSGSGGDASASSGSGGDSSASSGPAETSSASTGSPPACGDLACDDAESCGGCPLDCGPCPDGCGNGVCEAGEAASCPQDCNPQSASSSSTGGSGDCPPDLCVAGGQVSSSCSDSCFDVVCATEPSCCNGPWTAGCAELAAVFILVCPC